MDITIGDLRWKEVICLTDGTRYGYVSDILFDLQSGQIKALIVPGKARFFGLFGLAEEKIFPWSSIHHFGEDIILVDGLPTLRGSGSKKTSK